MNTYSTSSTNSVNQDPLGSGRSENLSGSCADERRNKFKRQSIFDQRHATKLFTAEGFTAKQLKEILNQVINRRCDLNSVKTTSKIKKFLGKKFALNTLRLVSQVLSDDGTIRRLILSLQDGHSIEAVIIKSSNASQGSTSTLFVSSQVGNNMDCTFCAKGSEGLFANLTSGEILEQLQIANSIERISSVFFMSMGEPLDNYKEVVSAIKAMTDPELFGLELSNVTISTVGIPEKIKTFSVDVPGASLSLALHSANQDTRANLIPSARMFPLSEIIESLDAYLSNHSKFIKEGKGRRVIIEYVLLHGINDSRKDARDLADLILPRGEYCVISPSLFTSPTVLHTKFKTPSLDSLREFVAELHESNLAIVPRFPYYAKEVPNSDNTVPDANDGDLSLIENIKAQENYIIRNAHSLKSSPRKPQSILNNILNCDELSPRQIYESYTDKIFNFLASSSSEEGSTGKKITSDVSGFFSPLLGNFQSFSLKNIKNSFESNKFYFCPMYFINKFRNNQNNEETDDKYTNDKSKSNTPHFIFFTSTLILVISVGYIYISRSKPRL